jgi:hypothetical protein
VVAEHGRAGGGRSAVRDPVLLAALGDRGVARDAVPFALRTPLGVGDHAGGVLLVSANLAGVRATWPIVAKPVLPTYWRQAQLLATAFSPQRQASLLPASTAVDAALAAAPGTPWPRLAGAMST